MTNHASHSYFNLKCEFNETQSHFKLPGYALRGLKMQQNKHTDADAMRMRMRMKKGTS